MKVQYVTPDFEVNLSSLYRSHPRLQDNLMTHSMFVTIGWVRDPVASLYR